MHNITSIVIRAKVLIEHNPMTKHIAEHNINDEPPDFCVISVKLIKN